MDRIRIDNPEDVKKSFQQFSRRTDFNARSERVRNLETEVRHLKSVVKELIAEVDRWTASD
jgi:hypothetical protein